MEPPFTPLTKQDFREFVKMHLGGLKYILEKKTDSVTPVMAVLHVLPPDKRKKQEDERGVIHMMLAVELTNDPEQRHGVMRRVGERLYEEKVAPLAFAFACEAWSKQMSEQEWQRRKHTHSQVSSYADKQEIVMVSGLDVGRNTLNFSANVHRDEGNNIILDGDFQEMEENMARNYLLEEVYRGYIQAAMNDDRMSDLIRNLKKDSN